MNRTIFKSLALILSTGIGLLSFVSGFAAAGAPQTAAPEKFRSVSWTEAGRYIHKLGVNVDDNRTQVQLVGFVLAACQTKVRFKSLNDSKDFSIEISDGLKKCLETNKDDELSEDLANEDNYVRVSKRPEASILINDRDVEIGYSWLDQSQDPAVWKRDAIGKDLKFVSQKARLAKEAADRKEKLLAKVNCAECRQTEGGLDEALSAIRTLVREGALSDDEATTLNKQISDSELSYIKAQMASAKGSDLENLDKRLKAWAARNKDSEAARQEVANLRFALARKLVESDPTSVAANDRALKIFEELGESGDVSADLKRSAQLATFDMRGNLISAQLASIVEVELQKGGDPMQIQSRILGSPEYVTYSNAVNSALKDACGGFQQSFTAAGRASMERCAQLRQSYQIQQARIQDAVQRKIVDASQKAAVERAKQGAQAQPYLAPGGVPYGQGSALFPSLGK